MPDVPNHNSKPKPATRYFLLGPGEGRNIFKIPGPSLDPYILNDRNEWELRHRVLKYLLNPEPDCKEIPYEQAMIAYWRITGGKEWIP